VWISGPKLPPQQKYVDKGCRIWFMDAGCGAMRPVENGEEMHQSRYNPLKTRRQLAAEFNPQSRPAVIFCCLLSTASEPGTRYSEAAVLHKNRQGASTPVSHRKPAAGHSILPAMHRFAEAGRGSGKKALDGFRAA
jgi:hypothetical protein